MKKKSIPTFIGLFVLIFGLAAGLVGIRSTKIFRLGASSDFSPQDVVISNVGGNSFTASWVTGKEALSFVKWGQGANLDKKAESANKSPSFTHSVSISGLTPSTSYSFKINSGGSDFDDNGKAWTVSVGPALAPPDKTGPDKTDVVSGSVLTATGAPVKDALVFLSGGGAILSTTTSQSGNWVIPLSQARTQDLNSYFAVGESTTLLEIVVNAGPSGFATAQVYPQSARPTPPIILGDVNDFKNAPVTSVAGQPKAQVQVPGSSGQQSGFNVDGSSGSSAFGTVTLESVEPGEVITSTSPEFFGEGPPGEVLTITVESEAQTATVTVPSSGDWKWTPPDDLPEGTHKVKISWRDAGGILRTIERSFVVQAAEGPAFESTPSGTATATPKASPTATASGTPIATGSATPSPTLDPDVSDSGVLTPTIALSIMGIGLIAFSLFIFKESIA